MFWLCLLNPPAYMLLKGAAYARHKQFKEKLEHDDKPMKDTWHQDILDLVYPL